MQMGTNHVGHALLAKLLLPALSQDTETKDKRIVVVSSQGYSLSRGIDYSILKTDGSKKNMLGGTQMLYSDSKLANVYFAQQLAAHHPTITTVSVHPGIVATGLVSSQSKFSRSVIAIAAKFQQEGAKMLTQDQGAFNSLWAATVDKKQLRSGGYYEVVGVGGKENSMAKDKKASEKLWEWTMEELKDWSL